MEPLSRSTAEWQTDHHHTTTVIEVYETVTVKEAQYSKDGSMKKIVPVPCSSIFYPGAEFIRNPSSQHFTLDEFGKLVRREGKIHTHPKSPLTCPEILTAPTIPEGIDTPHLVSEQWNVTMALRLKRTVTRGHGAAPHWIKPQERRASQRYAPQRLCPVQSRWGSHHCRMGARQTPCTPSLLRCQERGNQWSICSHLLLPTPEPRGWEAGVWAALGDSTACDSPCTAQAADGADRFTVLYMGYHGLLTPPALSRTVSSSAAILILLTA